MIQCGLLNCLDNREDIPIVRAGLDNWNIRSDLNIN